jgi:peptidoglycan/xylan/chitin deacetylase (PgdA/CDA1 family)
MKAGVNRPGLLAAVSVDLDEIPCYAAIHGLPSPPVHAARAIYEKALPRLARLFEEERIPATFFAIGSDLDDENSARVASLARGGHEIANHSFGHRYDLTRLDRAAIRREIERGAEAIGRACGERPEGFRAPGYTITDTVFDVLEELGVAYDSSVFPCPAYYAPKAAVIGGMRLVGRESRSIVDDPRVLGAPADPYRVGRPYWRRGGGVLELPIGVTRLARLPYIGTSVVLAGALGASLLTRAIIGRPLVSLELHGIDLADADADELGFLAPHQPDLRRPLRAKEAALRAAIAILRKAGYRFVTLRDAARTLGAP